MILHCSGCFGDLVGSNLYIKKYENGADMTSSYHKFSTLHLYKFFFIYLCRFLHKTDLDLVIKSMSA